MPESESRAWSAFVVTLKRIDKSKINSIGMALRNSAAVGIPLFIGSIVGKPLGGVAVSTGALNVAYSDGRDPYRQRVRRMLTWSVLGAFAVFVGSATGEYQIAAILVTALWAFIGGMCLAISTRAGDLGLNTLVMVIVYGARGALSPLYALYAALLVLAGGVLQTGLAVLSWPISPYAPERRAIAAAYSALADEIDPSPNTPSPSPEKLPPQQIQETLSALGGENDPEDARLRLLFDQTDRIRISVFLLDRLKPDLQKPERDHTHDSGFEHCIDDLRDATAKLVRYVAECLLSGHSADGAAKDLLHVEETARHTREICGDDTVGQELLSAINALVGQLRAVVRLAQNAIPEGLQTAARSESAQPWRLQVASWIGALRANFDWRSPVLRHAVRLAVCVAVADAIGRTISWQRTYWIPMTVAVVLKPDFASTFSRGALRLLGTFVGLGVATLLYHALPAGPLLECALTFAFTLMLRYVGPANYGLFSIAISGLIVFELAAAGTPPGQVVALRALNTFAGGVLALIAYTLWPTWERRTSKDVLADMLDAAREYFHVIVERFARDDEELELEIDSKRRAFRLARSNAQASIDRAISEPGISPAKIGALRSIMASALSLFAAILGLEAGLKQEAVHTAPETFKKFAVDVELTLYYLSASLRNASTAAAHLPRLRDDHARMLESRDAFSDRDQFVLIETDRLTTALNTFREQATRYLSAA